MGGQPADSAVADVIGADRWDFETAACPTIDAMRAGAEIFYQPTFVLGDRRVAPSFQRVNLSAGVPANGTPLKRGDMGLRRAIIRELSLW